MRSSGNRVRSFALFTQPSVLSNFCFPTQPLNHIEAQNFYDCSFFLLLYRVLELQNRKVQLDGCLRIARLHIVVKEPGGSSHQLSHPTPSENKLQYALVSRLHLNHLIT